VGQDVRFQSTSTRALRPNASHLLLLFEHYRHTIKSAPTTLSSASSQTEVQKNAELGHRFGITGNAATRHTQRTFLQVFVVQYSHPILGLSRSGAQAACRPSPKSSTTFVAATQRTKVSVTAPRNGLRSRCWNQFREIRQTTGLSASLSFARR